MSKEIEKYVGLYLLVYVAVLAVCGFFQYMAVCQGKSLACAFDMEGINTIITTTAYVLTPIVAIIGFLSWKEQVTYKKSMTLLEDSLEIIRLMPKKWDDVRRDYEVYYFIEKKMNLPKDFDIYKWFDLKLNQISQIRELLEKLYKIGDKFSLTTNLDIKIFDDNLDKAYDFFTDFEDTFSHFSAEMISYRYSGTYNRSHEEISKMLEVLSFSIDQNYYNDDKYYNRIQENIKLITDGLTSIKKQL